MRNLDLDVRVCVAHVLQKGIVLFAHPRLAVVAGDVVPVDAVVIELIQHGQAVLVGAALLQFTVVWLRDAQAATLGPIVLQTVGGWRQFLQLGGPEPAVDSGWQQVGTIATLEVTDATARPDVFDLTKKKQSDIFSIFGDLSMIE